MSDLSDRITITDEAYAVLATATTPGFEFRSTGTRQPDGSWLVPVDEGTADRLVAVTLPGETLSDTILRIVRAALGKKAN